MWEFFNGAGQWGKGLPIKSSEEDQVVLDNIIRLRATGRTM